MSVSEFHLVTGERGEQMQQTFRGMVSAGYSHAEALAAVLDELMLMGELPPRRAGRVVSYRLEKHELWTVNYQRADEKALVMAAAGRGEKLEPCPLREKATRRACGVEVSRIELSADELEQVRADAAASGLTVAEYARAAVVRGADAMGEAGLDYSNACA